MPLYDLFEVPKSQNDWEQWSFSNRDQINKIRAAILAQHNINLIEYPIYPIDFNHFKDWLESNQQSHNDFNSVLGLQSSDLEGVDPSNQNQLTAWIYLNYQELFSASAALKI